jgi:hypothetical protein
MKKIHIYLGLLNLVILFVFGVAGVAAFTRRLDKTPPSVTGERIVAFKAAPNSSDGDVISAVTSILRAGGCGPSGHDLNGNLQINCWAPNGGHKVTFLEKDGWLRIQDTRNSLWNYLENIHAMLPRDAITKRLLNQRLWSYYVEFSVWSLLAMCLTGLYLWLTTRLRHFWAWCAFTAGSVAFAVLYVVGR